MAEYYSKEAVVEFIRSYRHSTDVAFHMEEHLYEIPAADVRPVVRGKWITVMYHLYECSECGAAYQDVGYGFNYCPNCGAMMEES